MEKRFVYADNAATTPLCKSALDAMLPWLTEGFGNPSSIYRKAAEARRAIETSRADIAALLSAKTNEIYFTSGGTESDNWAVKGAALRAPKDRRRIIVSAVEHHAVLHAALALEKLGYTVTILPVDKRGLVHPEALEAIIGNDTALVSVMLANNEIGTIHPVAELAAIAKRYGALFHTDAVQAAGHIPVSVTALGVDLLSMSAHKLGGPKGVGVLYIRSGVRIENLLDGGSHERGRRAGTENVAGICGMSAALAEACANLDKRAAQLAAKRNRLYEKLLAIPYCQRTGDAEKRLPGSVSVVINAIEGEALIMGMDNLGIQCSSGSACTSGSLDPSHVLLAIGLEHAVAHGSLRLTLGHDITDDDIDYIAWAAAKVASERRAQSPLWDSAAQKPTHLFRKDV